MAHRQSDGCCARARGSFSLSSQMEFHNAMTGRAGAERETQDRASARRGWVPTPVPALWSVTVIHRDLGVKILPIRC